MADKSQENPLSPDLSKQALKVREGDYQVHVYLEETRGLVPDGEGATLDPLVVFKVFDTRKYTQPKDDVASGSVIFWGEHFFFNKEDAETEEIESSRLLIEVRNHRALLKDSLVGSYELDLTYIYFQPKHALIHKWIAISNPETEDFQTVRGHIKLGISIIAEGDDDVDLTAPETEDSKDHEILLPPQVSLKPYQMKITLIKAEGLPQLDDFGTIDAYCQAEFGGVTVKSSVVKADQTRYSVNWFEELYLPVLMPNVSSKLVLKILDQDPLHPDSAGSLVFEFKKIEAGALVNYFWANLYGSPANAAENHHKVTMNLVPEAASAYHGRLLLKIEFEECQKPINDCSKIKEKNIADYIRDNYEKTTEYEIRCHAYMGVDLSPKFQEYSVSVAWATTLQESKPAPAADKKCRWLEKLNKKILKIPVGFDALPDIFVYLNNKFNQRVCYTRLNPLDFGDVMCEPRWINLSTDKAMDEIKNDWEGGFVQLRIYVGLYSGNEDDKKGKWHLPPQPVSEKRIRKATLLFNLYQCRDLPAADSDGQSDPFVEVYCNGSTVVSPVIQNTINPMWYVALRLEVELNSNNDSPPVIVYVKDKDEKFDDLIGVCTLFLRESGLDSPKPVHPTWRELSLGKLSGGQLLCSMNLYIDAAPLEYNLEPECIEATAEINCLGLRDLSPAVGWLPVNKAFIKFDLNSLQIPSEKILISNIQTQPGECGPNPTINTVIKFNFLMPIDKIFAPSLTCVVYDYLLKGLSQPQIGVFTINLGKVFKRKPRKSVMSQVGQQLLMKVAKINFKKDKNSTKGGDDSVLSRPTVEAARKGGFVHYPSFVKDEHGKMKEAVKVGEEFIKLGYNRNPADKILHYRYVLDKELEDTEFIDPSPFESFQIKKGQERGEDSWISSIFSSKKKAEVTNTNTTKNVGIFKGMVRAGPAEKIKKRENKVKEMKEVREGDKAIMNDNDDEDFSDIRKQLLQKNQLVVRVYIISCSNLAQKDVKSHSDPYIKIKLAGNVINDVEHYQNDQPNPRFLRHFDILATLPGASRLKIQIWDKDELVKDDKIGETIIDLENRFFSNKWQRLTEKPIEKRQLRHKSTKISQGSILLWLEIHQPNSLPPPLDISDKPPEEFEARLIVWQTDGVDSYDIEDTSDLYVRAIVNNNPPKETDTHYRCQNGNGQFNWRMLFPITLPSESCIITLQIWDRDIFSPSDFIADVSFTFKELARDCFERDRRLKMRGGKDSMLSEMSKEDPDKFWVNCFRRNEDGENKEAGRVEISFELVPKAAALACPVGEGREEPNIDPFLPEPKGRFEWTLNPCKLISQTCGPAFRAKICCAICCVLSIYLIIMIAPSLIGSLLGRA